MVTSGAVIPPKLRYLLIGQSTGQHVAFCIAHDDDNDDDDDDDFN